jgi:hypothetical protein
MKKTLFPIVVFATAFLAPALLTLALATTLQSPTFSLPSVKNPTAVEFEPSSDHAAVASYELDILRPDNTVLQTINIGKPAPNASNICRANINVQPIAFGAGYYMKVRAVAGTSKSDDTTSLNPFERAPGAPSKAIAK